MIILTKLIKFFYKTKKNIKNNKKGTEKITKNKLQKIFSGKVLVKKWIKV